MANSDQEADNSLQPKLFAVNQPPQEENKPLCRSDDEDLSSEAFTPKEFCHLNGGQETYEVLSFSNPREDGACLKDVADPSTAGVTHTPDSSETDSPSSNSSIEGSVEEAPPKSKCSGQDLNGGYCGDVDTELDMSGIHKLQNPQRKLFVSNLLCLTLKKSLFTTELLLFHLYALVQVLCSVMIIFNPKLMHAY